MKTKPILKDLSILFLILLVFFAAGCADPIYGLYNVQKAFPGCEITQIPTDNAGSQFCIKEPNGRILFVVVSNWNKNINPYTVVELFAATTKDIPNVYSGNSPN